MEGHLQYFDVPKEALGRTESTNYYSALRGPLPSRFSPPAETEGGFMPRDPVLDGPYYETKHIKKDSTEIDITTSMPMQATQVLERCIKGGRIYQHGEIVSELNACKLCMCYFGYIHCQEPKCAPVVSGCYRVKDVPGSCCGRIQCGPNMTENSLQSSRDHVTTIAPIDMELMTNLPVITVADDIVTPDILKELAIRTEPAPDLTNMANFLTFPPPVLNITDSPEINVSSTSPSSVGIKEQSFNDTISGNITNKYDNKLGPSTEGAAYDDYGDFSLGSVLDMLFGNNAETAKPKTQNQTILTTPNPPTNVTLTNNVASTNTSDNYDKIIGDLEKVKDLPTKAPVYSGYDYDADIIRNTHEFTDQISVPSDNQESNISLSSVKPPKNSSLDSKEKTKTPVVSKVDPIAAFGLLKLDGCNIYGKMYRIGKVITELSSSCLECRCTQVGVQCEPLDC